MELATPHRASPDDARHHLVELYESDELLVDSVCGFLEPVLVADDAAVVVATEAHREMFVAELEARGVDLHGTVSSGRLVMLDAAETLARIMVHGMPDPARVAQTLEPLLVGGAAGGRQVRVYGEMVALLWADGNVDAAVALESLWNRLGDSHPFSLLCAYPMAALAHEASIGPFRRMCQQHTKVIPTRGYARLTDRDDQLLALAQLEQAVVAKDA